MLYIIIDENIIGAQKVLSKRKQNRKELSKALKKLTRAKNYAMTETKFLYRNFMHRKCFALKFFIVLLLLFRIHNCTCKMTWTYLM